MCFISIFVLKRFFCCFINIWFIYIGLSVGVLGNRFITIENNSDETVKRGIRKGRKGYVLVKHVTYLNNINLKIRVLRQRKQMFSVAKISILSLFLLKILVTV